MTAVFNYGSKVPISFLNNHLTPCCQDSPEKPQPSSSHAQSNEPDAEPICLEATSSKASAPALAVDNGAALPEDLLDVKVGAETIIPRFPLLDSLLGKHLGIF